MTTDIIDTHVHIFDTKQPGGVPWPPSDNALLYQTTLPEHIQKVSQDSGVTGAVVIECSPRYKDNLWALKHSDKSDFIKGFIGNINPASKYFSPRLEKLIPYKKFKGLRYGNLGKYDLKKGINNPDVLENLRRLARNGLVMDSANPTIELLSGIVSLTDSIPELTIIIDHLPALNRPDDKQRGDLYDHYLTLLSEREQVHVKVSAVLLPQESHHRPDLIQYRDKLDEIYDLFGPDRLLYGSDWPNSKPLGNYSRIINVVKDFFLEKGEEIEAKYFRENAIKVYQIKEGK